MQESWGTRLVSAPGYCNTWLSQRTVLGWDNTWALWRLHDIIITVYCIHNLTRNNFCQTQRWSACSSRWLRSWRDRTVKARRASTRWARRDISLPLWFVVNEHCSSMFSQTTLQHILYLKRQASMHSWWHLKLISTESLVSGMLRTKFFKTDSLTKQIATSQTRHQSVLSLRFLAMVLFVESCSLIS